MRYLCADDGGLLYLINMSKSSPSYVAGFRLGSSCHTGDIDDSYESASFGWMR